MLKADEMFEELGYSKKEEKSYIRYNNFGDKYFGEVIDFDLKNKKFRLTNKTCQGNTHFRYGSMQELQAINEKCKELRLATIEKDFTLSFFHRTRKRIERKR